MAEKSMNDLVLNNEPDFRLLRLILLDSYSPGGEAIIVLRDGAIMTGENGSGKTSLIRLIPIFLGENPGKVNVGTEGFINFYLARTTSYIIFEYQRRDMVCQAVLYAGNEDSYTYRFIRTGYDLALYTDQDGKTLLANASLGTHLKTMGILHSRALAMSEYRAIIQGHYSAGKDAGNQRAYVHDYAFTSGNQRLDHIDKIVSGMFTRQANFRDFLRMVVSYITEDERAIAISGDRAKIGKWPEHYTAYQEVMRHSDHMEQISALGAKLLVNDDAIKVLHARFRVLIDHHEAQQRRLNRDHADVQELIETARLDHEKKVSAIREKEQAAGGAAKQVTDQAARIRQQHDAYRLDGISDKAAVVAALEANKASLDNLKERKGLLLGAKAGIDQRYTALKLDVEKAFVRTQMESTAKTHAVEAMFAPRLAGLALEQRSQEQVLREASRILRDEKQALLDTAIGDRASWLSLQANPVADGVIEQALVVKQAEVETARSAVTLAEGASIKASQIKMEAVATFQRLEKQVQEAQESLDQQEKAIKALIASANPAADSLLGFLREHYPGWTDTAAKVIDPALLHRSDLSPALLPDADGALYGISLDLSRIHTPLFADETQLQQSIQAGRARQTDLQIVHAVADQKLAAANDARERAQQAAALNEVALAAERAKLSAHIAEEVAAKRAVVESKRLNSQQAGEKAAAAGTVMSELKRWIADVETQLAKNLLDVENDFKARVEVVNRERIEQLNRIQNESMQASDKHDKTMTALDFERDGVLAKEGIDTERLQALEAEIEKVGQMISDAGKWADLVAAWNLWHRDEWPRVPVLEKEAAEHVKAADRHKERRERLESDWAARLNAELKHIKAIADGARLSGEIAQQARTKLPRLEDFEPDSATLALHYDPLWTADELAAMANKQFSERRVHESDLKGRVREIKSAFRSGRGSPTEQYFETIEGTIDPDDDNPRAWIEPFRLWYDRRHEEFLRTLLLEAQSYGRLINRFKDDIDTFDRQIKDFNRGMRFALGRTIVFPRIGQITVTFSSTINDKSYWQPIREFVENHQAWISGFGRELPPPSFSEGLGRLMQHWEMREGIKADRLSLIEVSGKVVENGKEKAFVDGAGLKELSSNGLSYLILTTICVAFLQMIRGDAKSQVTAAVDEILDLDSANIGTLVKMLRDNGIDLISACPDADLDVMMHFKNRYKVIRGDTGPEIHEVKLIDEAAYV